MCISAATASERQNVRSALYCADRELLVPAEEEGNAPYRRDGYENVDSPCEDSACTAECKCNEVEVENADETPVDASDDEKYEGEFIPHRCDTSFRDVYSV